jgi:hypothetical protein
MKRSIRYLMSASIAMSASHALQAQDAPGPTDKKIAYSPYPAKNFPNRVYFGDTHLHTSLFHRRRDDRKHLGPEEAYRFARGEEVKSSSGLPAKLQRPLDFLVVADHSENLGLAPQLAASDPELLKSEWGRKVHDLVKSGKGIEAFNEWVKRLSSRDDPFKGNDTLARTMWQRETAAAEKYNDRVDSPRSSASNGPRPRGATTCTATSSSAAARSRPTRSSRSRSTTPWTRRCSGSG